MSVAAANHALVMTLHIDSPLLKFLGIITAHTPWIMGTRPYSPSLNSSPPPNSKIWQKLPPISIY